MQEGTSNRDCIVLTAKLQLCLLEQTNCVHIKLCIEVVVSTLCLTFWQGFLFDMKITEGTEFLFWIPSAFCDKFSVVQCVTMQCSVSSVFEHSMSCWNS